MDKAETVFKKMAVSSKRIIAGINRAGARIRVLREAKGSTKDIGLLEQRRDRLMKVLTDKRTSSMSPSELAIKRRFEINNEVSAAAMRAFKGEGPIGLA